MRLKLFYWYKMTAAKVSFDSHIVQCDEAIEIYEFLESKGYSADFGLRFVWVASVSALDHYISELVVEKATELFSNGKTLSSKLQNEKISMSHVVNMDSASPTEAILKFHSIVSQMVRLRTFQKSKDVADGLAYIWDEKHKWDKIAKELILDSNLAKKKLNSIGYRRDQIVHSADYNFASGSLRPCKLEHAREALNFIIKIVNVIDIIVP